MRLASELERVLLATQQRALTSWGIPPLPVHERRALERSRCAPRRSLPSDELDAELRRAPLVLLGDYATAPEPARAAAALLRRDGRRRGDLVLSCLPAAAQSGVDAWLEGRGTLWPLERRVLAGGAGPARWTALVELLEAARRRRWNVHAVGVLRSLSREERDRREAHRLVRRCPDGAGTPQLWLTGEGRLAPFRLPRALARAGLAATPLRVLLGSGTDAARPLDDDTLVVLPGCGAPGLAQSALDVLELEPSDALTSEPAPESFFRCARAIARRVELDIEDELARIRLLTPGTLSGADALLAELTAAERTLLRRQVLDRESAFLPRARLVYLASGSLNHLAEEAGHFVRACATGSSEQRPRRGVAGFYGCVLEEAMAFWASRWVNPRRPCAGVGELRRAWASGSRAQSDELSRAAAFVLAHKAAELHCRPGEAGLVPRGSRALCNIAAHALGYLLGDALDAASQAGALGDEALRILFRDPFPNAGEAYLELVRRTAPFSAAQSSRRTERASAGVATSRPALRAAAAVAATSS